MYNINDKNLFKFFSASFLMGMIEGKNIDTFKHIIYNSNLSCLNKLDSVTIIDVLNQCYFQLLAYYKNEYVYKNILIKNITQHIDSKQFSLISEMDIGKDSRIDIALFNKTSEAYEIKTDLDTLQRLDKQLHDYTKGFEKIWILTSEKQVENISKRTSDKFGIKYINQNNKIELFREAKGGIDSITHAGLFSLLKQKEYMQLLKRHYGHIPNHNTNQGKEAMINMFKDIDIETVNQYTIDIISYRVNLNKLLYLLSELPNSLLSIGLSNQVQKESTKFLNLINLKIADLDNHITMMEHRKLF